MRYTQRAFVLVSFLIMFVYSMDAQNGIHWSEPVDINTSGNSSPTIGVLENGSPAMIWGKGSTLYFTKMINGVFIDPMTISTGSNSPDIYSFGGIDMAIKDNLIFIVYENFQNGVFTIRSIDGGDNFEAPVNVYDPIAGKWATLPSIEIDDEGNPHVSVILENTNETNGNYIMMRSNDGGITYTLPTIASEPSSGNAVCECCPSDIFIQQEDVFLVFRNNDNNLRDMWVSKSTDKGDSFQEAVDVDATDWVLFSCPISGPKMEQLSTDSLITIWKSGGEGAVRVYISTLNSSTMEKGIEVVLPLSDMGFSQGSSDISGTIDTLGMVWVENGLGTNGADLMFAFSTHGSSELLTNFDNITPMPLSQNFPSLAYSNGVFHLLYTNGTGLQYLNGAVNTSVAVDDQAVNNECLKILENPISNRSIVIESQCAVDQISCNAQLIDVSGNIISKWDNRIIQKNRDLVFDIPTLPNGNYVLSIQSALGIWSKNILVYTD